MSDDGRATIHELDPQTVERIAAGEVVERPASVVKELVENAIDADAGRVDVTVEAGGTELIRVADDGVGMTGEGVRTAVEQHTTSKIANIDDLEAGVRTLGFRGEALHAIGAVSRLTVRTRPRGVDRGTELVVEGGEVTDVSPAGCPEGTTVEVRDLFFNVPARRKYLKQESTEFGHVNAVVTGYALARPDVAVSLTHGERETFATTGGGELREAVLSVYGREVARSMIAVRAGRSPATWSSGETPGDELGELPEGPLTGVSGLVSDPETTRASREYVNAFVNGRYVTASSVREAVVEAYGAQLAPDRYPFAALFCEVDPGAVDVNVHPRKLEVRFADEAGLREQVEAAVSGALMREGLERTGAPRGRSAPEQTEIRPGATGDGPAGETTPTGPTAAEAGDVPDSAGSQPGSPGDDASGAGGTERGRRGEGGAAGRRPDPHEAGRKFRGDAEQERLGEPTEDDGAAHEDAAPTDGAPAAETFERLPAMRILGQLHGTYVAAETADGLVLIDQHAADERVNYERLRAQFRDGVDAQALAEAVTLELTAGEAALAVERAEALERLGFRTERVEDRAVRVTAVPSLVAGAAPPDLLREVLADLLAGERDPGATVEAAADELLADLACYPSITGNTPLTEGSVRSLLAALDDCENPWACPHGRPVVIELASDEIEARFERDYPGHGG